MSEIDDVKRIGRPLPGRPSTPYNRRISRDWRVEPPFRFGTPVEKYAPPRKADRLTGFVEGALVVGSVAIIVAVALGWLR